MVNNGEGANGDVGYGWLAEFFERANDRDERSRRGSGTAVCHLITWIMIKREVVYDNAERIFVKYDVGCYRRL